MDLDDEMLDTLASAIAGDEPGDAADASDKAGRIARVRASLHSKRKEVARTLHKVSKRRT
eukprot:3879218-Karenia_brevis.AAC.1